MHNKVILVFLLRMPAFVADMLQLFAFLLATFDDISKRMYAAMNTCSRAGYNASDFI
jgi:hypothetical protein